MIEEVGVVTQVDGNTAKVIVKKRGACDGCTAKGICETKGDSMEIEALNTVHACVGQTVKISIRPRAYLKGTMFVYGLPLVLFIAGAIAGKNAGEAYFKGMDSDLIAALCGFGTLVISLVLVRGWAKKMESKTEQKPVIEEIVKQG